MLQIRAGDRTYPLAKKTVIGSDASADVVLTDPAVKSTHCVLSGAGSRFMLMVLDPTAEVLVNGQKASQKAVKAGDELRVGAVVLRIEDAGAGRPANATLPPADTRARAVPVAAAASAPVAVVIKQGEGAGTEFPLDADRVTIGRHPESTVRLGDHRVSASHGELQREGDAWVYRDVGSSGGSRVNGIKVDRIHVSDGDEIEVGDTVLVLRVKTPAAAAPAAPPPAIADQGRPAAPPIGGQGTRAPAIGATGKPPPPIAAAAGSGPLPAADDDVPTPAPVAAGPRPAGPYFEVRGGPDAGKSLALKPGVSLVGRDPRADVVLTDPGVSARHAEVRYEEDRLHFRDLGSTAGSKVNGIAVDALEISDGDELLLGNTALTLRIPSTRAADPAARAGQVPAAPAAPATPAPAADAPRVTVVEGPDAGATFTLAPGATAVGRDPRHGLVLTDGRVSGTHGEFRWVEGRLAYRDLGSTAGSKVNDITVEGIDLTDGDEVSIGATRLRVALPAAAPAAPARPGPVGAPAPAAPAKAPAPVPAPAPAAEPDDSEAVGYSLLGIAGPVDGKVFLLFGEATIGSGLGCEVYLPPESGAAERHALIFDGPTGPAVRRLGADVTVQDAVVELLPLAHGDVIGCGTARLLVRRVGAPAKPAAAPAPVPADAVPPTARYRLRVRGGATDGAEHPLHGLARIGRDPARNDIVLTDAAVSGRHCELVPTAQGWSVRDVGSSAGTFLDGARLAEERPLRHGARLELGHTTLVFEDAEAALEAAALPAAAPEVPAARPAAAPVAGVRKVRVTDTANPVALALLVVAGPSRGARFEFGGLVRIGRHRANDIVLEDPEVSNDHARITEREGRVRFEDLKSTNGSRINDEPATEKLLNHGDVIELGDTEFMFLEPGRDVPALDRYARPSLVRIGEGKRRLGRTRIPLKLTIGRAPGHGIVLDDTEVSGDHCTLEDRGGAIWIRDHSSNGTRLNGKRLKAEARLVHGDQLKVGAALLVFKEANKSLDVQELRGSQVAVMLVGAVVTALLCGLVWLVWPESEATDRMRENLLARNPSFDDEVVDGALPGWRLEAPAGMSGARDAGGKLLVTAEGAVVAPRSQFAAIYADPILWRPRCAWELKGKVRGTGNTGGAGLRLRFLGANGTVLLERFTQFHANTRDGYTPVDVRVRPPEAATGLEVACVVIGRVGTALFDDIRLHAIPLAEAGSDESTYRTVQTDVADQFGKLQASMDPRGVVSISREGAALFGRIWFELRGFAKDPTGVRASLLEARPSAAAVVAGKALQVEGHVYDFAAGEALRYTLSVRPAKGATKADGGGIQIEVDLGRAHPSGAGAVEAVLVFEGAAGRADWTNRRLRRDGAGAETGSDFPLEPNVATWVIGKGQGETAIELEPPAALLGTFSPARGAVDATARASADFQGVAFGCHVRTAGPDTAGAYTARLTAIEAAKAKTPPIDGEEFTAIKAFLEPFAWVRSVAAALEQRRDTIAADAARAFGEMKAEAEALAAALEEKAAKAIPVDDDDERRVREIRRLLNEFRARFVGVGPDQDAYTLDQRIDRAYNEAKVGVRLKRVEALLAEARAAVEEGDLLLARILVESLTERQEELLAGLGATGAALFELRDRLNKLESDAEARQAAFAEATAKAATAEQKGNLAEALAAWRAFVRRFPMRGFPNQPEPAPEEETLRDKADDQIRRLTRKQ